MKRNVFSAGCAAVVLALFLLGLTVSSSAEELKPSTMTWVAGGVGGGWYVQAGGIARLITEKEPKIILKVVPGGGVVNPVRVASQKDDFGWGITFVDKMAYKGLAPVYKRAFPDVRSMGGIFGIYHIHFVGAASTGVQSVAEMADRVKAGKAIKVAAPMKGTSDLPLIKTILGFYGISLEDIEKNGGKVFNAVYADMVNLYKDKHVDFVFTHLALPGAAVTEMAVSRDTTILPVSEACVTHLHEELGTLALDSGHAVIPSGTYKGQTEDATAVVSAGEFIVGKHVPEIVAYTVIKTICENIDEVHAINVANTNFIPENGWKNVAVPLHPGAKRYYKEAGYMD